MKERKIKLVIALIQESKQHLSDISSSVGPATSKSLKKIEIFLADVEKEIAPDVPKESWTNVVRLAVTLGMLLAFGRLLQEFGPEAVAVIGQILRK